MGFTDHGVDGEVFGKRTVLRPLARLVRFFLTGKNSSDQSDPSKAITARRPPSSFVHEPESDRASIRLSRDSTLHVLADGTQFNGVVEDIHPAAKVTIELLRDRGNGVICVDEDGTEAYKLSLWAHAQLMRLIVLDYDPPPHLHDRASLLVEELRASYAQAGIALRPFRPPSGISNGVQRYYLQNYRQRFGRLAPSALGK